MRTVRGRIGMANRSWRPRLALALALLPVATLVAAPAQAAVATTTTVQVVTAQPVGALAPVTLAATVTPVHTSTQKVEFRVDNLVVGWASMNGAGRAELTLAGGLEAGNHTVMAGYPGTDGYTWSNSTSMALSVVDNRATVDVDLTIEPSQTLPGDLFDMDVVITPNPGSGMVRFLEEPSTSMGDMVPVGPDGTVQATGFLNAVGTWNVKACFLGNATYRNSCSDPVAHVIERAASTTTLSIEPARVYPDEPFTVTVDVVPAPEGDPVVRLNGLPAIHLDETGHGEAEFVSNATLTVGEHDLTANFPGSHRVAPSSSDPVHLSIYQDPVTLTIEVEETEVGEPITVHATIDPPPDWVGAGVDVHASGPAGTGRGQHFPITLGPDGTGSFTVDTDYWPAGTWWFDASFNGSTRTGPAELRDEFELIDLDPPVGELKLTATNDDDDDDVTTVISSVLHLSWPANDGLGFGVMGAYLSNDGETWTQKSMLKPFGTWALLGGDGLRTVYAKWIDQAGNWSEVASVTVTVDTGLAHVTEPDPEPPTGDPVEEGLLPLHVEFEGATDPEGVVVGYEVQESVDGGSYEGVTGQVRLMAAVTTDRRVRAGHSYRYRVRAVDAAGSTGEWAVQERRVDITAYQQTSGKVEYRGTWRTKSVAEAWGGSVRRATAEGARVSLRTTSTAFAWVARTGPGLGKATVWIDGRKVATVNLYSAAWSGPKVVWAVDWSAAKARTVSIRVAGTAGHPGVEVDGFYTFR